MIAPKTKRFRADDRPSPQRSALLLDLDQPSSASTIEE